MGESLASQIDIDSTESFYPERELRFKKVGRKRILNREIYLEAVKKLCSMSDSLIARDLCIGRNTVWRYRTDPENRDIIDEAKKYLEEISSLELLPNLLNFDVFKMIPIVKKYEQLLIDNKLAKEGRYRRLRGLYNMCVYLNCHPRKLNVYEVAKVVVKMRDADPNDVPKGLAYTTQRVYMRSFFMLYHDISPNFLTKIGIDSRETSGSGRYARERVTHDQRHEFIKALSKIESGDRFLELEEIAYFDYYTGTRKTATTEFNFNINRFWLRKDTWMLEVVDKGRGGIKEGGGIKWEKIFIGDALFKLNNYCSSRFNIIIDKLETELTKKVSWLFPIYHNISDEVSKIFRKAWNMIGINPDQPVHILRHTFAQDGLDATNGNYELIASLGGWKNVNVLKKHYGERSFTSRLNGLKEMMGIPVEKTDFYLEW